mgnify:CR=1 FL=1
MCKASTALAPPWARANPGSWLAEVAGEIGAQVVRNARVSSDTLPPKLAAVLETLPVGHATPVIAGSGNTLRVLVLCHRG